MATLADAIGTRSANLAETQVLQRQPTGFWRDAWRRLRKDRVAVEFDIIFSLVLVFVLSGPLISEYITGYTYSENHLAQTTAAIGEGDFILGSDGNGRDVLTRLAYGGQTSLIFALAAMLSILVL